MIFFYVNFKKIVIILCMIKIKVNLDKDKYESLIIDMSLFNIIKKDGIINKNKFMNLLFGNIYDTYLQNIKSIKTTIDSTFGKYDLSYKDSVINELSILLFEPNNNAFSQYYDKSLTFYLSDKNEMKLNELNDTLKYQSYSLFFRKIIYHYLSMPRYIREQIIHKQVFEEMQIAINKKHIVKLQLYNNKITSMKPYKYDTTKEEIYTFVLGKTTTNRVTSIKLSKIKSILITNNSFSFVNDEINLFNEIIKCGINFPCDTLCNAEIILSKEGIKMYNKKYLNKSVPYKVENNHYFFKCSQYQLFLFFSTFQNEAKIVSPSSLVSEISNYYNLYNQKNQDID